MGKSQLQELKGLEKENTRLKRIVADLELDKLILKESLNYLKPRDDCRSASDCDPCASEARVVRAAGLQNDRRGTVLTAL